MIDQRWLNSQQTADYLGVRVDALSRLVKLKRIPPADYTLGPRSPRWDREALDAAFQSSSTYGTQHGLRTMSIEEAVERYAKETLKRARKA